MNQNERTLYAPKNPIVVNASEYRGKNRLDIRHHFAKDGELNPTQKGVNILLDDAENLILAINTVASGEQTEFPPTCTHRNPIWVKASEWQGKPRLDIRHHYTDDAGEIKPTRKGVSLPFDEALSLAEIIKNVAAESLGSRFSNIEA
jgi:hypothetical protein